MGAIGWIADKLGLKVGPTIAIMVLSGVLVGLLWLGVNKVQAWKADSESLKTLQAEVAQYQKDKDEATALAAKRLQERNAALAQYRKINESLNNAIEKSKLGDDDQCRWPAEWVPSVNKALEGTAGR